MPLGSLLQLPVASLLWWEVEISHVKNALHLSSDGQVEGWAKTLGETMLYSETSWGEKGLGMENAWAGSQEVVSGACLNKAKNY